MAWNYWHRWIVAFSAVLAACGTVRGEDDAQPSPPPRAYLDAVEAPTKVLYLADEASGTEEAKPTEALDPAELPRSAYWIGLAFEVPLPELAKEQLGIEHGLTVSEVFEGSPAAKAEFKKNDILIKAGDTPLKDPADLIRKVDEAKESELSIALLRAGKEQTLKVTPTKRPEAEEANRPGWAFAQTIAPEVRTEIRRLEEALQSLKSKVGDDGVELFFARPAVVGSHSYDVLLPHKLPENLKIQITRQGSQPAKIHVEQDGKEWDVTEDKLGELPPELSAHVQQSLGHRQALRLTAPMPPMAMPGMGPARVKARTDGKRLEGVLRVDPAPGSPQATMRLPQGVRSTGPEGVVEKLNIILKKLDDQDDDDALKRLSDEVQQLRKEVDELRKQGR